MVGEWRKETHRMQHWKGHGDAERQNLISMGNRDNADLHAGTEAGLTNQFREQTENQSKSGITACGLVQRGKYGARWPHGGLLVV